MWYNINKGKPLLMCARGRIQNTSFKTIQVDIVWKNRDGLHYLCASKKKNSHETSNLTPQRYTGSCFDKGTNSIAYTIVMTEITGSTLFNAYWGRPMKLAS